jgi:hypothetical protein
MIIERMIDEQIGKWSQATDIKKKTRTTRTGYYDFETAWLWKSCCCQTYCRGVKN